MAALLDAALKFIKFDPNFADESMEEDGEDEGGRWAGAALRGQLGVVSAAGGHLRGLLGCIADTLQHGCIEDTSCSLLGYIARAAGKGIDWIGAGGAAHLHGNQVLLW